jgi:carboxymethylenebutenolidase
LKKYLDSIFPVVVMLATMTVSLTAQNPRLTEVGGSRAFIAGPEDAGAAVIIVHDWFGITDMTRQTVGRFGSLGYLALAVDLYHGESASTHARAGELLGALDQTDAQEVLAVAIQSLSSGGRPVGLVAFSAGALPALQAAATHESVRGIVAMYGGNLEGVDSTRLTEMSANILLISGSVDEWALGSVESVQNTLSTVGKAAEVYIYPNGGHGFAQPLWNDGADLDATATRLSWMLIDDFLERNLR